VQYTFSPSMAEEPWHFMLIHKALSPSHVDNILPDILEEMKFAFDKVLSLPESGGKSVKFYDTFLEVLVRINNRMLVGLPLCRDDNYITFTGGFVEKIAIKGLLLAAFPKSLQGCAARVLGAHKSAREGERYLVPLIEKRRQMEADYISGAAEKPNDFLQQLIDAATPAQGEPRELAVRMLSINLASTHTSALPFTRVFYDLLAHPQYIDPLREEAETAIKDYGWTKDGIKAMVKLDSFFKESMRFRGIQLSSLNRRVLRPMTLSDGTKLPAGGSVAANAWGVHHDSAFYSDPETFVPFRFSDKIEQGESAAQHAFWTASTEYLVWGHGSHVCAGRIFITHVLKALMAHILLNCEFKVPDGEKRPKQDVFFAGAVLPEMKGKVEFSRRQEKSS